MDEMRKMLDSLMGQSRNASLEEAKEKKGKYFTEPNVCKFYLLGFCPQYELRNSKLTTKRNLGECNKVHSDAMKAEFEASPEKDKYQAEYEKQFLPFLESQVREADAWVARERANAQKAEASGKEKTTINTMPANVKEQIEQLTVDMNKMMSAAEDLAEKGDIEGSKFKVVLAEEIKNKVKEIEAQHPSYTVTLKEEWVCEVCGTRTEAVTESNVTRFEAHFTGKVHLGYAKIRDWVKELRKKQRDGESSRYGSSRDAEKEKGRRRSRSRGRGGGEGREREKEPKEPKGRDKNEGNGEAAAAERRCSRDGDGDRKRRRSRSRGRDHGEDRARRRHRSASEGRKR